MESLICEPLGLFGWNSLEPVLLAALSTKLPLLLVGKHGCAKSFILERLAESLKLNYRFYNASLINYDDLVGIPIPTKDNKSLEYIANNTSIWDAEVVFIDEINRTKPELQNKLFPIIYDKRVQGQNLEKLQYRWAAMNPPFDENSDEEDIEYFGAMPLDPALADRFPFIVNVPNWLDLSEEESKNILIDQYKGKHSFPIDINVLIEETYKTYTEFINDDKYKTIKYIQTLMNILIQTIGYISIRRATMLESTLLAIHAARIVLNNHSEKKESISFVDSCILAINNTLPINASKPLDKNKAINISMQAYKIAELEDGPEKKLLLINDSIERIIYALRNQNDISSDTLGEVITSSLANLNDKYKRALSLVSYLSLRTNKNILAMVIETLLMEASVCLEPKSTTENVILSETKIAQKIAELNNENKEKEMLLYRNNLLNSYLPDGFQTMDEVIDLANFFEKIWSRVNEQTI